jgi:hypothetical protein
MKPGEFGADEEAEMGELRRLEPVEFGAAVPNAFDASTKPELRILEANILSS